MFGFRTKTASQSGATGANAVVDVNTANNYDTNNGNNYAQQSQAPSNVSILEDIRTKLASSPQPVFDQQFQQSKMQPTSSASDSGKMAGQYGKNFDINFDDDDSTDTTANIGNNNYDDDSGIEYEDNANQSPPPLHAQEKYSHGVNEIEGNYGENDEDDEDVQLDSLQPIDESYSFQTREQAPVQGISQVATIPVQVQSTFGGPLSAVIKQSVREELSHIMGASMRQNIMEIVQSEVRIWLGQFLHQIMQEVAEGEIRKMVHDVIGDVAKDLGEEYGIKPIGKQW